MNWNHPAAKLLLLCLAGGELIYHILALPAFCTVISSPSGMKICSLIFLETAFVVICVLMYTFKDRPDSQLSLWLLQAAIGYLLTMALYVKLAPDSVKDPLTVDGTARFKKPPLMVKLPLHDRLLRLVVPDE